MKFSQLILESISNIILKKNDLALLDLFYVVDIKKHKPTTLEQLYDFYGLKDFDKGKIRSELLFKQFFNSNKKEVKRIIDLIQDFMQDKYFEKSFPKKFLELNKIRTIPTYQTIYRGISVDINSKLLKNKNQIMKTDRPTSWTTSHQIAEHYAQSRANKRKTPIILSAKKSDFKDLVIANLFEIGDDSQEVIVASGSIKVNIEKLKLDEDD